MTAWELLLAGALYLVAACRYAFAGKVGLAITFSAYALANIGLMIGTK